MAVQDLFREDTIDASPFDISSIDTQGISFGKFGSLDESIMSPGSTDEALFDTIWADLQDNPPEVSDTIAEQIPVDENMTPLDDEAWEALNMELNTVEAQAGALRDRGVRREREAMGMVGPDHPDYQPLPGSIDADVDQWLHQRRNEIIDNYGLRGTYTQEGDKDQFMFDPTIREWRRVKDVDQPSWTDQIIPAATIGFMTAGIGNVAAPAIASATGLGSTASGALGGAVASGSGAALRGEDLEGVLTSAGMGAVGGGASGALNGVSPAIDTSTSQLLQDTAINAFRQPNVSEEQTREAVPISEVPRGQLDDYILGDIYAYPRTGTGSAGGGGGGSSAGSGSVEDIYTPEDGQLPSAEGGAGADNEHQWVYRGDGLFRNVLTGETYRTNATGDYEVGQVYARGEQSAPQDTGEEESPPQFGSFEDFRRQAREVVNRGSPATGSQGTGSDSEFTGSFEDFRGEGEGQGTGTGSGERTGEGTGTGSGSGSGQGSGEGPGSGDGDGGTGGQSVAGILGMGSGADAEEFYGGLNYSPQGLLKRMQPRSVDYVQGLLSRL